MKIAAVARTGALDVDQLLKDVAHHLQQNGWRVGGAIRVDNHQRETHPCDALIEELISGEQISLSQIRGTGARGCQLDTAALARVAGLVNASLDDRPDLLIVNKFGKREAEGSGLVDTIARAVEVDIPVLISVSEDYVNAWHAFCGEASPLLTPDRNAIDTWLDHALPAIPATQLPG